MDWDVWWCVIFPNFPAQTKQTWGKFWCIRCSLSCGNLRGSLELTPSIRLRRPLIIQILVINMINVSAAGSPCSEQQQVRLCIFSALTVCLWPHGLRWPVGNPPPISHISCHHGRHIPSTFLFTRHQCCRLSNPLPLPTRFWAQGPLFCVSLTKALSRI